MAFDIRTLYDTRAAMHDPIMSRAPGGANYGWALSRSQGEQLRRHKQAKVAQTKRDQPYREGLMGLADVYDDNVQGADRLMGRAESALGNIGGMVDTSAGWRKEDRGYWDEVMDPTVRQFQKAAQDGVTGDYQGVQDRASADVRMAKTRADESESRRMAAMGINPASGRYVSSQRANDMSFGLAEAGSRTNAYLGEKRRVEGENFGRLQAGAQMAGSRNNINLGGEMSALSSVSGAAAGLADRYADAAGKTAAGMEMLQAQRKRNVGGHFVANNPSTLLRRGTP